MPNMNAFTDGPGGLARLTGTTLRQSAGTVLNQYGYGYNLASQRTRMTRIDGSYVDYTHDPLGEVIKALGSGGESTENLGYKYDPAWNLNTRTNAGYTTPFNVDVLNQLTTVSNLSCTYDANGNLTARVYDGNGPKTYHYTYDDENQLTSAATDTYYTYSSARWRSDYTYDGRQRLRKRVDYIWNTQYGQWQLSADTRYLYVGDLVVQERNGANTPTVSYVRGTDLSGSREGAGGIGGLLARSDQYSAGTWGRHVFYHADGNGNITYLVDGSQALAAKYRYDPFGNTTCSSGTLANANAYRFSSKAAQPNSGLYYYGYRFYDPYLQRWLCADPLWEFGFRAVHPDLRLVGISGMDVYGFVGNSAVNDADPFGLVINPPDQLGFTLSDIQSAVLFANRCGIEGPDGKKLGHMYLEMLRHSRTVKWEELSAKAKEPKTPRIRTTLWITGCNPVILFPRCDPASGNKEFLGEDGQLYYFHAAVLHELVHAYGRMTEQGPLTQEANRIGRAVNDCIDKCLGNAAGGVSLMP
jgi:RHS repeat-associated protein